MIVILDENQAVAFRSPQNFRIFGINDRILVPVHRQDGARRFGQKAFAATHHCSNNFDQLKRMAHSKNAHQRFGDDRIESEPLSTGERVFEGDAVAD